MNGKIIPDDYIIDDLGIYNIFENTVAINFNYRWLSIFVFFISYLCVSDLLNLIIKTFQVFLCI